DEIAFEILSGLRDASLRDLSESERARVTDTWDRAVRLAATEYLVAGLDAEARRLGALYLGARRPGGMNGSEPDADAMEELVESGALRDVNEGLVACATLLGQWGERDAARRLLLRLRCDYPHKENIAESNPGERVTRGQAAETARLWKQAGLVSA